ncbi:Uncharacterized protein TCM_035982 [Theobroma cacao]|uniref:Uncharacterized protein n=1 Tax=Theobroma cacao TaxID=3641 RepID=A0A061FHU7_THECC|nr:Uncharacterized protein TCM_035982 [Theobroma cacao]
MAFKRSRGETGKGVVTEKEDILDNVATYLVKLMDQIENMDKDMRGLMDKGQCMTGYFGIIGLSNVKLMITYGGHWVDDTYKGDDYIGEHDDYSKDYKVEHNDILVCNHADGSTEHATTIVLEEVWCNDHATTVELEDVEGTDPIYDNPISLENEIH